jgi:predicted SnoaL-like aldol condensation-catalyzing enzyme
MGPLRGRPAGAPRYGATRDGALDVTTAEQNVVTARRWLLEVFNDHDLDAVPEIIADTYRNYGTTALTGVEAGRAVITQADGWAPDRRIEIIETAASGDGVFLLLTLSGTHTGPFMGVPPSKRRFSVHLVDFFRFDERGKMIEGWVIGKGDLKQVLEALHTQ